MLRAIFCQTTPTGIAKMPNLDKFDIAILKCLQEDARATNVEIAEKVNLSPSPCLRRIRNLEKSGVIRGYRADIDRKAVGLGLAVFVEIKGGDPHLGTTRTAQ